MKILILTSIFLFNVNAFSETKINKKLPKNREQHDSQWKQCATDYKKYIELIRARIKANKIIGYTELKQIEKDTTPLLEVLVSCQGDNLLSPDEGDNIMGGAMCLNYFSSSPKSASNSKECKKVMKPFNF